MRENTSHSWCFCASSITALAMLTGTTTTPSSSATMMSPGITVTPPHAIGTLTAFG